MIAYLKASELYTPENAYIKFCEVVRLICPHLGIHFYGSHIGLIFIAQF
jgi:hypothetical protein